MLFEEFAFFGIISPPPQVRYDGEDVVFERVLPTMTVGAFKSRVAVCMRVSE